MANTYKVIDEKTWERAMHCMVFRNSVEPAFCVTFDADITNFLQQIKKQIFFLHLRLFMRYVNVQMKLKHFVTFFRWSMFPYAMGDIYPYFPYEFGQEG